jgi:hypothetical protein
VEVGEIASGRDDLEDFDDFERLASKLDAVSCFGFFFLIHDPAGVFSPDYDVTHLVDHHASSCKCIYPRYLHPSESVVDRHKGQALVFRMDV